MPCWHDHCWSCVVIHRSMSPVLQGDCNVYRAVSIHALRRAEPHLPFPARSCFPKLACRLVSPQVRALGLGDGVSLRQEPIYTTLVPSAAHSNGTALPQERSSHHVQQHVHARHHSDHAVSPRAACGSDYRLLQLQARYYDSFITDGGVTWATNMPLSGGFSNATASGGNGVVYVVTTWIRTHMRASSIRFRRTTRTATARTRMARWARLTCIRTPHPPGYNRDTNPNTYANT
jgi:hypothetical protein